jgi:hypothetical protein
MKYHLSVCWFIELETVTCGLGNKSPFSRGDVQ